MNRYQPESIRLRGLQAHFKKTERDWYLFEKLFKLLPEERITINKIAKIFDVTYATANKWVTIRREEMEKDHDS